MPQVNDVIDMWKIESHCAGIVRCNTIHQTNCLPQLTATAHITDIRPYDRRVVFSPHKKYENFVSSSIFVIPKHERLVKLKLSLFSSTKLNYLTTKL